MNNPYFFDIFAPPIPCDYDIPPTVYSILNSYVNFDNPVKVKISDLAKTGRVVFFDFDYDLTENVDKETFETMILNHFLMRRIGYETVTAFKIALMVKINEIMPKYNILFDSINNWNLFNNGEVITRSESTTGQTQAYSSGSGSNISDRRFSNTPQNEISNVQDGKYVTEYNYDTDTSSTSNQATDTTTGSRSETINRSLADKNELYIKFSNEVNNVYTLIFKELEPLFYGLV